MRASAADVVNASAWRTPTVRRLQGASAQVMDGVFRADFRRGSLAARCGGGSPKSIEASSAVGFAPREKILLRHRLRDEEPLREIAAETPHEVELLRSLDTLGDHLEVHCFTQCHDSLDDAFVVRRL